MQTPNGAAGSSAEIDFFEIFEAVWKKKWLPIGAALAVGLVAAAYAFLTAPIYESKYYISPPTVNDISNLNYGRSEKGDLKPFLVDQVYGVFLRNLQSESQRRVFFESTYLSDIGVAATRASSGSLYEVFSKNLTIAPVGKEENGRWSVSIQGSSPEWVMKWVELYVNQVGESTVRELTQNVKKEAYVLERNLELEIDTIRESSYRVRQDAISKISEALNVAKSSGLENTVVFSGAGSDKLAGSMVGDNAYMRGSKALEAELKNLESRKSDDPFTPELRNLQARVQFYKQLQAAQFEFSVFRHDGVLDLPSSPIKPKKYLIIFLGLVIGGLLGSSIAVFKHFETKRRKVEAEALGSKEEF